MAVLQLVSDTIEFKTVPTWRTMKMNESRNLTPLLEDAALIQLVDLP